MGSIPDAAQARWDSTPDGGTQGDIGAGPLRPYVELWREAARAHALSIAAVDRGRSHTYGELDLLSDRIAWQLRALDVRAGAVVAICRRRDVLSLAAMLALFKLRAAYLPVDPALPARRKRFMVESCDCGVVLCDPDVMDEFAPTAGRPRHIAALEGWLDAGPAAPPDWPPGELDDLAYVIFTSGSTGRPKGAMMSQRGMVNHLWAKVEDLALDSRDVIAQTASHGFDLSVWQYLAAGLVGARTVVFARDDVMDGEALLEQVLANRVTILQVVPSHLSALMQIWADSREALARSALRAVVVAGEALPAAWARRWFALAPITLVNAYGPTECGADVTHHIMRAAPEGSSVPIGRAVRGARLQVVDPDLRPVAAGASGELLIGGIPVGMGYFGSPQLTAAAFTSCGPGPGRWYRSGDLVRQEDGVFWFLGRLDNQIKLRGHRVEPGEIEAALCEQDGVVAACVILHSELELTELVAVVQDSAPATPEAAARRCRFLLGELGKVLPAAMVPRSILLVHSVPLNANGKVDRTEVGRLVSAMRPFDAAAPHHD
jgi:amino acid adenylation domain-containing protein